MENSPENSRTQYETGDASTIRSDEYIDPEYIEKKLRDDEATDSSESHKKHERKGLGWKKPAAVVALLGAVAAGALGVKSFGGESNPSPENNPTSSARVNPGEAEVAIDIDNPAESVGIPQTSFENLNVKPSQEVVERAQQPTLVEDFSAADAIVDLMRKQNIYTLSGELLGTQGEQFETPESQASGTLILDNTYAQSMDPNLYENLFELRKSLALRTAYFGTEEHRNVDTTKDEPGTYNTTALNVVKTSETDSSATFNLTGSTNTNFQAIDKEHLFENPNVGTSMSFDYTVTIVQEDDRWLIEGIIDN